MKDAQFLDDVQLCVASASAALTARGMSFDVEFEPVYRYIIRKALQLCWTTTVKFDFGNRDLDTETCTMWSVFKKKIFSHVAKLCNELVQAQEESSKSTIAQQVEGFISARPPTNFLQLREFISSVTLTTRARFHAPFRSLCASMSEDMEQLEGRAEAGDIDASSATYFNEVVRLSVDHVDQIIKPEWVTTLSKALESQKVSASVAALFPSEHAVFAAGTGTAGPAQAAAAVAENDGASDQADDSEPAGVDASLVDTSTVIAVNQLRGVYMFNLLHNVSSGTTHCANLKVTEILLKDDHHPFWTQLSAFEERHVLPCRRTLFWSALWTNLSELVEATATEDNIIGTVEVAHMAVTGELSPQHPTLSHEQLQLAAASSPVEGENSEENEKEKGPSGVDIASEATRKTLWKHSYCSLRQAIVTDRSILQLLQFKGLIESTLFARSLTADVPKIEFNRNCTFTVLTMGSDLSCLTQRYTPAVVSLRGATGVVRYCESVLSLKYFVCVL